MRNIFLIGMPSSGKSTLGRRLAKELGYTFVDLDQLIVADQDMSISEIFSRFGEPYFRETENRLLQSLPVDSSLLVATGGGAPCFYDNMDFILRSGLGIFLDVPAEELAARIKAHAKDDRPLLSGLADLEEELRKKLEERRHFYSRAHLTLSPGSDMRDFLLSLPGWLEQKK